MKPGDISRVHFIGVGGIGMSALARLCLSEGKKVSGSDLKQSDITEALKEEGVRVSYKQVAGNIAENTDLVIYTEAINEDNEELKEAKRLKLTTINYFDALGLFLNDYYLIAVAGSHGKTTTTAMVTEILEAADLDPTAVIGSLRRKTNSNFRAGKSKYAVVEACEFRRDFLSLKPDILVITNIEYEHVDYYKNLADVQKAFNELAEQVSDGGVIIANTDDPQVATALEGVDQVKRIDYTQFFDPSFETLPVPGVHNRMNAAAAIAVAQCLNIDVYLAREALRHFQGTWRRLEAVGSVNGAPVLDDYAHHPTEIRFTLTTLRELYPDKNIKAVFQPHSYARTHTLFDDFATELSKFDEVMLLPIYNAREKDTYDVSSEKLQQAISEKDSVVRYFPDQAAVVSYVQEHVSDSDVLLIMGAGEIAGLATQITD